VHEKVFRRFPDADISASIVWIPILDEDSLEAASPCINPAHRGEVFIPISPEEKWMRKKSANKINKYLFAD
jgi:hypothetical protein